VIVLDTNVVSELIRPHPNPRVGAWLDDLYDMEIFTTAITVAELLAGVERLPPGRRQTELGIAVRETLTLDFRDHILPFDDSAASEYARIVARRSKTGRPIGAHDAMIAAITATDPTGVVATRNVKDFEDTGVHLINPWDY
jgi:predicted nucleic acid-binding protein